MRAKIKRFSFFDIYAMRINIVERIRVALLLSLVRTGWLHSHTVFRTTIESDGQGFGLVFINLHQIH